MRSKELLRKCQVKTRNALYCLRRVLEAWTGREHTCSDVGWNGLISGIQLEELEVRYLLQQYPNPKLSPPRQVEVEETQEHPGHPNNQKDTLLGERRS
jgi:hypothetical protein